METALWVLGIGTLVSSVIALAFGVRAGRKAWKGDLGSAGKNGGAAFVINVIAGLFWLAFLVTGGIVIIDAVIGWVLGIGTLVFSAIALVFGVRAGWKTWRSDYGSARKNGGAFFVINVIAGLFWFAFVIAVIISVLTAIFG